MIDSWKSSYLSTSLNPNNFQAQRLMQIVNIKSTVISFTKEIFNNNNYHYNDDNDKQEKSTTTTKTASPQTNLQGPSDYALTPSQFFLRRGPRQLHRRHRFNHEKQRSQRSKHPKLKHGRHPTRNRPGEPSNGHAHRTRQHHSNSATGSMTTTLHLERSFQPGSSQESSPFHG